MKKLLMVMGLISMGMSEPILQFYCGATMAKSMRVLSDKFETQENVKVNIIKGGSGKLYKRILLKKDADLFLPGSDAYIKQDTNNLFSHKRLIGYNKPVLLVQKGNPKNIKSLDDFENPKIRIVLGAKNSGSVGKITKKILTTFKGEDFYEKIYNKALKAPTSIEIIQALKDNKADVSINWKAAVYMDDNENYVDYENIPYIAPKRPLYLVVVKYSQHPKLAKKFVDFIFKNKKYLKSKGF